MDQMKALAKIGELLLTAEELNQLARHYKSEADHKDQRIAELEAELKSHEEAPVEPYDQDEDTHPQE